MQEFYYRPEWTCGRYNSEKHCAIFFNNISGYAFEFEEDSADVIGIILSAGKNGKFSIKHLAEQTGILEECLTPFLEELHSYGLVTNEVPSSSDIAAIRKTMQRFRIERPQVQTTKADTKGPIDNSTAEMRYADVVGGLTSIMFEMTYRCPEKCIHCYNPGATRNDEEVNQRGNREELTLEDYKHIIDELYEKGVIKVCLSGGDPFSNKHIWDVIDYLYHKDIAFDVYTNGLSIQKECERLANYYPRLVGVSIYSGSPDEHDYITRVQGSWLRSMEVVKQLSNLGVPLNLKCCVMRPNVKHYHEVDDLAKQYGAKAQFEVSVCDSIEGDNCVSQYLRLPPEVLEIVLCDKNVPLYVNPELPNFGVRHRPDSIPPCGAAQNSFCLTPEGNLTPCCAFQLVLGNLKETSLEEVLQSDVLRKWNATTIGEVEECNTHEYCDFCNLCPGNAYSEHGTYMRESENCCFVAKVRYNLAMKLREGYDPLEGKTLAMRLAELPDMKKEHLHRVFKK